MFGDPLTTATTKLLSAVEGVNRAVNQKKQIIMDAQETIDAAQVAINGAKKSLNM